MKSLKVFISYSSNWPNESWVSRFVVSLNARGAVSTVSDAGTSPRSDEDISLLENRLLDCDLIVVFAGENSTDAPFLFFEYGVAVGADKEIVLVVPKGAPVEHLPDGISVAQINSKSLPSHAAKAVVAETSQLWERRVWGEEVSLPRPILGRSTGTTKLRKSYKFNVRLKVTKQNVGLSARRLAGLFLNRPDVRLLSAQRSEGGLGVIHDSDKIDLHFEVLTTQWVADKIYRRIKNHQETISAAYHVKGQPGFRRRTTKEADVDEKVKPTFTGDFRRNDN